MHEANLMFEVNYKNFRVICQNCRKTGTVDTTKYQNDKSKFFYRVGCEGRGREFNDPQIDYWLCANCLGVETKR